MKRKIWLLALAAAVLLGVSPALADGDFYVVVVPGGVGTKISSLPYTITAPGFYYHTGNLTCPSGDGITVNADDVTLDLMGFCLSGNDSSIGIYMNQRKNVEIRNGSLRGWNCAIYEKDLSGFSHRVINVRAENNNNGIFLHGKRHLVKGCTVEAYDGFGIWIDIGTASGNQASNCINWGICLGIGNVIGNVVGDCTNGISLSSGNVIANAVTCDYGQTGINLSTLASDPTMVDQNTVRGDGTHYSGGGTATEWGVNAGK